MGTIDHVNDSDPRRRMEMAARQILRTAPGVPVFISRRWVGTDGGVDWTGLEEWLRTKGGGLSDGEKGVVAGAIALARLDFGALDALDAEAVGRALEAAGATYRGNAADGLDQLRRAGLLDESRVDELAGGDRHDALIARIRADERHARDAAWTALLASSRIAVLEHSSEILINTHGSGACTGGVCPLHRRSRHSMRGFPQNWREDRGLMERICPHGIGHPDPDDVKSRDAAERSHACDGCCA